MSKWKKAFWVGFLMAAGVVLWVSAWSLWLGGHKDMFDILMLLVVAVVAVAISLRLNLLPVLDPPTLADVMRCPTSFFNNSEWDDIVAVLVAEEAAIRTAENENPIGFSRSMQWHEDRIWDALNRKLGEAK